MNNRLDLFFDLSIIYFHLKVKHEVSGCIENIAYLPFTDTDKKESIDITYIYRYTHMITGCRDITYLLFTGSDMKTLDV